MLSQQHLNIQPFFVIRFKNPKTKPINIMNCYCIALLLFHSHNTRHGFRGFSLYTLWMYNMYIYIVYRLSHRHQHQQWENWTHDHIYDDDDDDDHVDDALLVWYDDFSIYIYTSIAWGIHNPYIRITHPLAIHIYINISIHTCMLCFYVYETKRRII